MPRWRAYGVYTGSKYLGIFEAEGPDQAERLAEQSEHNHVTLCHQCARELEIDEHCANSIHLEEVDDNDTD